MVEVSVACFDELPTLTQDSEIDFQYVRLGNWSVVVENMQDWPLPDVDITEGPAFMTRVLEETQCGLLLDTAHARITAAILNRNVRSYLEEFPLSQIVEIHVSSP